MRDDFDSLVADHFKVLDDVPVPDTWSRVLERVPVRDARSLVPFSDAALTMIDLETPVTMIDLETPAPTEPRRRVPNRAGVAALLAAAAVVVAIVLVATRDDAQNPANEPAPTVTVPPISPPRSLIGIADWEQLAAGTYFVDEVGRTPTPQIFFTIGAGWSTFIDEGIAMSGPTPSTYSPEDDVGFITFSRPDQVYLDACHLSDGFTRVATLDGLVAALSEQRGWDDVTAPSDISVDGYPGKTFQRTAPAVLSDCPNRSPGRMRIPELDGSLKSWQNEHESNFGGAYYEPGQHETLTVLDIDGTVVVINANLWAGSSEEDRAEFAAVLDSIRIDPA